MIWAALLVEYTGIDKALEFSKNNLRGGGHLIVTTQANNGIASVSPTGITSVQQAAGIFQTVDEEDLLSRAAQGGFRLVDREENFLPNGKSFKTFKFALRS